jgi:hypothetical protein
MTQSREIRHFDPDLVKTIVVKGQAVVGTHEEREGTAGKILIVMPGNWSVLWDQREGGKIIIFPKPTPQAADKALKAARGKSKRRPRKGPRAIPVGEAVIDILLPRRGVHPKIISD